MALAGILLASACSKTNPIFSKVLFEDGWTPLSMYFLTLLFVTIVLALHEFMHTDIGDRWEIDASDLRGIALTTFTGGVAAPLFFLSGLQFVQASEAIVINTLSPLFIVLFAVLMLGERFTKQTIMGACFLVAGSVVLVWQDLLQLQIHYGVLFLVAGAMSGALTTIFHKKYVTHRHLDSLVLIRTLVSLIVVGVVMTITEPESFILLQSPPSIWIVLGLSVIAFIIPYFLYFRSIRYVRSGDAAIVLMFGPVIGVLMAHVFLGEQIETQHLLSLGLVAIGIFLINVPLTKWRIMPWRLMSIGPLRR